MKRILNYFSVVLFFFLTRCDHSSTNELNTVKPTNDSVVKKDELLFGSFSPGGSTLVYGFDGDLWFLEKLENGTWSNPQKIAGEINTTFIESNPAFSPDGKRLYFSSNRNNGFGGLDIYVAEQAENGNWVKVINLGPAVNTKLDEDMPYVSKDGNRFYFSSKAHQNIGGYDIFMTEIKKSGMSLAEPMADINTKNDDFLYYYFLSEGYAVKNDSIGKLNNLVVVNMSFAGIILNNTNQPEPKKNDLEIITAYLKGDIGYSQLLNVFGNTKIKGVHYELQIGASSGELNVNESVKKLGKLIIRDVSDSINRYSLGKYKTLDEVEKTKLILKQEGFSDAFLVCYSKGQKSDLHQLLNNYIAKNEVGNKK